MTPAEAHGQLRRAIETAAVEVEVVIDITWLFLRRPGLALREFEDAPGRDQRLGKWIVDVPAERLLDEATRLLPAIHDGTIKLAKLTNVWNFPQRAPELIVYCVDRDATVEATLTALGWRPRWKYNHETHAERTRPAR